MIDATDPGLRAALSGATGPADPSARIRIPLRSGFDASTLTTVSERLGELLLDAGDGDVAGWEIGGGVGTVRVHGRPDRVREALGRALLECGVTAAERDDILIALSDPDLWA